MAEYSAAPCPGQIGNPTLAQAFARSSGPVSRATLDPDIAMDGGASILRPETGDKHGCEWAAGSAPVRRGSPQDAVASLQPADRAGLPGVDPPVHPGQRQAPSAHDGRG